MDSDVYVDFKDAADAAFCELSRGQRQLAVVVPTAEGQWRVAYVMNKANLKSPEKIAWLHMWEDISKLRDETEQKDTLWKALLSLTKRGNKIASKAIHAIELHSHGKGRSPGFEEGSANFAPASGENPFLRG